MLGKLLKHDLRSVWRFWWLCIPPAPISILCFVLAIRGIEVMELVHDEFLTLMIALIVISLFFVGMILAYGAVLATPVLTHYRFYKNLFTDEGYLTFTLPIKRRDILRSKTINSIFWQICLGALFLCGGAVAALFSINGTIISFDFYLELWDTLAYMYETVGFWTVIIIGEMFLYMLVGVIFTTTLVQFCITFGATVVRKGKLIVGVLIYLVTSYIMSFIGQTLFFWLFLSTTFGFAVLAEKATSSVQAAFIALVLLLVCIVLTTLSVCFYFLTRNILERRLNLA